MNPDNETAPILPEAKSDWLITKDGSGYEIVFAKPPSKNIEEMIDKSNLFRLIITHEWVRTMYVYVNPNYDDNEALDWLSVALNQYFRREEVSHA